MKILRLTEMMRKNRVKRIIIITNEPLLGFKDKWHQITKNAPTKNDVEDLLHECVPANLQSGISANKSFSFEYEDTNGKFHVSVSGNAGKRCVNITDKSTSTEDIPAPPPPISTKQSIKENVNDSQKGTPAPPPPMPNLQSDGNDNNTHTTPPLLSQNKPKISWFYYINNQRLGPISQENMEQNIRARVVKPETIVWCDGMTTWQTAESTELRLLFSTVVSPPAVGSSIRHNTSGPREFDDVPTEIRDKGFHWGAFLLGPLWALFHGQYGWALATFLLGFFYLIPGYIAAAFMASRGYELAWKGRRWTSVQHCLETQKIWTKIGVYIVIISIGFFFTFIILVGISEWGLP